MRHTIAAAFLAAIAVTGSALPATSAATGHWYCTGDGIKSWTANADAKDAHGWSYDGDRAVYKDQGHCKHAM